MSCPDCNDTGWITLLTSRVECECKLFDDRADTPLEITTRKWVLDREANFDDFEHVLLQYRRHLPVLYERPNDYQGYLDVVGQDYLQCINFYTRTLTACGHAPFDPETVSVRWRAAIDEAALVERDETEFSTAFRALLVDAVRNFMSWVREVEDPTEAGPLQGIATSPGHGFQSGLNWDETEAEKKRVSDAFAHRGPTRRVSLCRCGSPGEPSHTCPYAVDIHGDYEWTCNCCDGCTGECAADI